MERYSRVSCLAGFHLDTHDDFRVLEVSGPLAHSDSDAFREALDQTARLAAGHGVVIDLSRLEFICSAGMRLLVQFERTLDAQGRRMVTAGLRGTARETIEMCGIFDLLTTAPSVADAVRELRGA
jgi:anti-anti-sigma factor